MSYVRVMSHDKSHDEYGKVVHRPCSSCISSVQKLNKNVMRTSSRKRLPMHGNTQPNNLQSNTTEQRHKQDRVLVSQVT